jgi:hypothetical protein
MATKNRWQRPKGRDRRTRVRKVDVYRLRR